MTKFEIKKRKNNNCTLHSGNGMASMELECGINSVVFALDSCSANMLSSNCLKKNPFYSHEYESSTASSECVKSFRIDFDWTNVSTDSISIPLPHKHTRTHNEADISMRIFALPFFPNEHIRQNAPTYQFYFCPKSEKQIESMGRVVIVMCVFSESVQNPAKSTFQLSVPIFSHVCRCCLEIK